MTARRTFGAVRKRPSGRYEASYLDPAGVRRRAPATFATKREADGWLAARQTELDGGIWRDPQAGKVTLDDYFTPWLAGRDLRPRTRVLYQGLYTQHIAPTFGSKPLERITPTAVRAWHAALCPEHPTRRSHAYALLRTVLGTAVSDDLIAANPCRVRGAGTAKRASTTSPATFAELDAIVAATPARYRAMVLLAAWCGLRMGEVTELRRGDVAVDGSSVTISRAVTRVGGRDVIGKPKTDAGIRTVSVPPHLRPAVVEHLADHVPVETDALLFPNLSGGHMHSGGFDWWYPAREAAGRPDLRFHDLRHTGATLAAVSGATLKEVMSRLGHSTPVAALRYQHAGQDRDKAIAEALSAMHEQGRHLRAV